MFRLTSAFSLSDPVGAVRHILIFLQFFWKNLLQEYKETKLVFLYKFIVVPAVTILFGYKMVYPVVLTLLRADEIASGEIDLALALALVLGLGLCLVSLGLVCFILLALVFSTAPWLHFDTLDGSVPTALMFGKEEFIVQYGPLVKYHTWLDRFACRMYYGPIYLLFYECYK